MYVLKSREFNDSMTEKYYCNECGCIWFSDNMFEDLCPSALCESEHIFSIRITEEDKEKRLKWLSKLDKYKDKIAELENKIYTMSMVKRKSK